MKRALLILIFALTACVTASTAQNIALGERAPELKPQAWYAGQQPLDAPMVYVEFFVASNKAALPSIERIKALSDKMGAKLQVVIVTREKEEVVTTLLKPLLSKRMSVALDPAGKIFTAYGVSYVPFGVLVDAKNRALWMGNSRLLTEEVIEKSK